MNKTASFFIALFVTSIFLILFYFSLSSSKNFESVVVSRVIDGDTIEFEDGRIARLVNINAPEKNTPYAMLSTSFLKNYENKSLNISVIGIDKYSRLLVKIYTPEYLNLNLVKEGLASTFLVADSETKKFKEAEQEAIKLEKGMWQHSKFYGCFKTKIYPEKEVVYFYNSCNVSLIGWTLKDESRKQYKFNLSPELEFRLFTFSGESNSTDLFWNSKSEVWNNDRDTLYLYDNEGKIVHFNYYGY